MSFLGFFHKLLNVTKIKVELRNSCTKIKPYLKNSIKLYLKNNHFPFSNFTQISSKGLYWVVSTFR